MRRAPRPSPACKWIAPQQPCSGGMKTSQPFCCKTRSVAQWVWRNMASATQPTKKATRARFRPTAGRNRGSLGPPFTGGGKSGTIRPSRPGISRNRPIRSARSNSPVCCANRTGRSSRRIRSA